LPRLVVQDSGPGLSDADLSRLGDRFFRVPGNGADGSGLGWSIVRRLAQRYRLHVLVARSAELGGLRVVLTWPAP
jgi:two-component system sensor histidine kinase QseC